GLGEIEPEPGLAHLLVGAVTDEAVARQDRPDVAGELDLALGLGTRREAGRLSPGDPGEHHDTGEDDGAFHGSWHSCFTSRVGGRRPTERPSRPGKARRRACRRAEESRGPSGPG